MPSAWYRPQFVDFTYMSGDSGTGFGRGRFFGAGFAELLCASAADAASGDASHALLLGWFLLRHGGMRVQAAMAKCVGGGCFGGHGVFTIAFCTRPLDYLA